MAPRGNKPRHPDSTQLVRQWAILRILSDGHRAFSVKELADQLGVSKLSIARDLTTLERHFALVEETQGKQKRVYRIAGTVKALEELRFGAMELLSLHAARSVLAPVAGAPFFSDLHNVIDKVRGALGAKQNGMVDALVGVFLAHTRKYVDYAAHGETIDLLVDGIARRLGCLVTYRAGGRTTVRDHEVHPLKLLFHDGALYLVCRFAKKSHLGMLAVHRITEAKTTGKPFQSPRLDIPAFTRPAFGIFQGGKVELVEVLFERELAWLAEERIFHPDEEKKRFSDGRVRLRVKTPARGEVVSWVLRFGGKVKLLRPAAWRADVARLATQMASAHAG